MVSVRRQTKSAAYFYNIMGVLKTLWRQIGFSGRYKQERLEQQRHGCQFFLMHALPGIFALYREGDKQLVIDAQFTSDTSAVLSVKSLEYWFEPRGEKLSVVEFQRAKDRFVKFYSVWGDVTIDDSPVREMNEIIADLNSKGIDFHKLEDTYYAGEHW